MMKKLFNVTKKLKFEDRLKKASDLVFAKIKQGNEPNEEEWEEINNYLCPSNNIDKYDYSNYGPCVSVNQFAFEYDMYDFALRELSPWRSFTCACCGDKIYMEKGQVDFYKKKDLELPNRCKTCRDKRREIRESISQKQYAGLMRR